MEKLNKLPPLSNAARKILEIIYNPDIDISVFVEVVEQDPVLLLIFWDWEQPKI